MKTANIALGFGIGLYYSVGINTSLFWGMLYYAAITGYTLSLIFKDKMVGIDKSFGAIISIIIFMIYIMKAIVYEIYPLIFDWVRFYTGIFFVALSMIYFIYCVTSKLKAPCLTEL